MNRLDDKVALISGAARGIGAQTARLMTEAGAKVVIGDVLSERCEETARALNDAAGAEVAHAVRLDVSDEASWSAAVGAAEAQFGKLDILVNNAGIFLGQDYEEVSLEDWNRLVSVNLTGVFLGTRVAAPALRKTAKDSPQGSSIVNLSSIAGLVGAPLDALYSMTKGGVTVFTKSTALDFARKKDRIRVNSVHPGVIETDMGQQTIDTGARIFSGNDMDLAVQRSIQRHPMGRHGTVDDIARAIVFLASDDSGFMTGSSMVVDGGLTAA